MLQRVCVIYFPKFGDGEANREIGTIPDVQDMLEKRAGFRLPPRSKSPIKTFLKSPARKNPSFDAVSSPTRGTIVVPRAASVSASVRRTLNFSNGDSSLGSSSLKKRAESALPSLTSAKLTATNHVLSPLGNDGSTDMERSEDYSEQVEENTELEANIDDDVMQMGDTGNDDESGFQANMEDEEEEPELEPEPELVPKPQTATAKKMKRKAVEQELSEQPAKKARGRPKRTEEPVVEEEPEKPTRKTRRSLDKAPPLPEAPPKKKSGRQMKIAEEEPELDSVIEEESEKKSKGKSKKHFEHEEAAPTKKPTEKTRKTTKSSVAAKAASKSITKKPKLAAIEEIDSPQVKRGPPLPRNNRGLVILRRETPAEGLGFKQTRSGRNSIKPLAYWKNERIEFDPEEENSDGAHGKFLLPSIKEVIRADELEAPVSKRSKSYYRSKSKKARTVEPESEDDSSALIEPWESEPGRFVGEVREWDPTDPQGTFAEEVEEEIAFSKQAIVTQPVKHASFRFAKTLTLPFFGSGMVDLPPGAVKKPKNSRSMQLVFFVHTGRVKVRVNETEFRIGRGGMWQVPRGMLFLSLGGSFSLSFPPDLWG
jgi:centromere protein C